MGSRRDTFVLVALLGLIILAIVGVYAAAMHLARRGLARNAETIEPSRIRSVRVASAEIVAHASSDAVPGGEPIGA